MGADRSRSRKFGDSVRKSVPCPPKRHPDLSGFDISFCQEGSVSNLIWLCRKTRFSQAINQVLHIFCAFENGYPLLGAANAVSWI